MYPMIHALLEDKKGGITFTCFSVRHVVYILAAVILIAMICLAVRKNKTAGNRAAEILIDIAFGLYVADFFLMPLAYGEIDIEKLPFHICTAMCAACFLSRRIKWLERYRLHFALLGFVSNLVYLIYPAGLMWQGVHPFCYRVIQTLAFHGLMTAYGFITLLYDEDRLSFKTCCTDLMIIACMSCWAVLGNLFYNGRAGDYDHFFNWFFVVEDPFGMIDPAKAPFIMPIINIVIFFAAEMVIYGFVYAVRAVMKKKCS